MNDYELNALGAQGMAALERGGNAEALRCFSAIAAAGRADGTVWVALALARQALDDLDGLVQALDAALTLEPQNVRALLMKGDVMADRGDRRAAVSFYGAALDLVPNTEGLPPEAVSEMDRVRGARDRLNDALHADLTRGLIARGYDPATASPRFNESLELLAGRKTRYVQEPRSYFFPGLPTIQFYPREDFPWLDTIEAAAGDILAELQALMADGPGLFAPYVEAEMNRPATQADLLENDDWSACYLWRDGVPVAEIAARCPKTMAALEHAPLERIAGRSPFALFSKLTPGAVIAPHTGFHNSRLVCHLPLIAPKGCWFRVGNETRTWEPGKAFVFDDTIEHEARNDGAETRIVLIFNIWRPELTQAERGLVAGLMEGIAGL